MRSSLPALRPSLTSLPESASVTSLPAAEWTPARAFGAARIQLARGRKEEAFALVESACAAEPEQPEYRALHAWLRAERGELKGTAAAAEILATLTWAVRERRTDLEIRLYRGRVLSRARLCPAGEKGGIPERMMFHDVGHVISGYGVDPRGEIRQAAFQAGYARSDGFVFLLFGIVQFHIGLRVTPVAQGERGYFDVLDVLRALARGAACRVDFSDHFDLFQHAHEQVGALRSRWAVAAYGVSSRAAPWRA